MRKNKLYILAKARMGCETSKMSRSGVGCANRKEFTCRFYLHKVLEQEIKSKTRR